MHGLLAGKTGLVMGVANDKSIAWGIAEAAANAGAHLIFTYQNEALQKRVIPLAASLGSEAIYPCDVADDASIEDLFKALEKDGVRLDFVVHAIAYANKDNLKEQYYAVSRPDFGLALDISCYSFTAVARHAAPLLNEGASLLTLSYYGAEKTMPHYNIMGVAKAALEASVRYLAVDFGGQNIRVNAISAGPIKTLAASGIGDFRYILKWNQYNSPLKRNVTTEDVGKSALFLLSDLASGVTGEILHVDCGYHCIGMKAVDAPDITVV
jgi:enoyl-[acyl-carrier protein] reductase I